MQVTYRYTTRHCLHPVVNVKLRLLFLQTLLNSYSLQIALEQSYKQQQQHVEAEQSQLAADISRLATAVAHKRVSLETAGLKDYQTVFESVVDYVCAAAGLANRTSAVAAARAEVSAAVESVFPLSGVAYFITLPGNERRQQVGDHQA